MEKTEDQFNTLVKKVKLHEKLIKHLRRSQYYAIIRIVLLFSILYFVFENKATVYFKNGTYFLGFIVGFVVLSVFIYLFVKRSKMNALTQELKKINLELYAIMKLKEDEENA